jgi:hypothetical protein
MDTAEALLGRADEVLYADKAARPRSLNLLKSVVEPSPTKEAENRNIRDRHALTLNESTSDVLGDPIAMRGARIARLARR